MKITFFFSCCVAKLIEDMLTNRRRRRKCIFWSIVVGSLATVFIVTAVRDALLASRFICTVDDIVSNHITKLCDVIEKEEKHEHGHILFRQDLCKELCAPDVSSRITCHTFHLNKPTVFTLDSEEKKVVKSVIKLEDREVSIGETSTEENEVYWNLKPGSHQYFPTKEEFLGIVGQQLDLGFPLVKSEDEPTVVADWMDRCRTNVGEDAVNDIKESAQNLVSCVQRIVVWSKLQHEINRSIPRGELDLVFKKYCGRRERLMGCLEDYYTKFERCMNDEEKQVLNITRRAIDAGIDFVCYDDGDRIALFMAENGEECVMSQKDNIVACIEERNPEIKEAKQDPQSLSLSAFTITEDNCKNVNAMHQCIVEYTEKCKDPTPSNILDSLIKQALKVTPCWQKSNAPTLLSHSDYLLSHLLTLIAAALTAANILL